MGTKKKSKGLEGYASEEEYTAKFSGGKYKNRKEMLEKMEAPIGVLISRWAIMTRAERSQYVKAHPECVLEA